LGWFPGVFAVDDDIDVVVRPTLLPDHHGTVGIGIDGNGLLRGYDDVLAVALPIELAIVLRLGLKRLMRRLRLLMRRLVWPIAIGVVERPAASGRAESLFRSGAMRFSATPWAKISLASAAALSVTGYSLGKS
jgi:hypothetical protein